MTIYPAIDLKSGRCVRLRQGDPNQETLFSEDPVGVALEWSRQGAEWLHVVDLDGAFSGRRANAAAITAIVQATSVPVQLGGGLRSLEQLEAAFEIGVRRGVLGTAAYENPLLVRNACDRFPGRIAVGIDVRNGFVAIHGWKVVTDTSAVEFARRMEDLGVELVIYTDIARDGVLEGPNLNAIETFARAVRIPVVVSGGVSSLNDLLALKALSSSGVGGVIVGRALYERRFTLREARSLLSSPEPV